MDDQVLEAIAEQIHDACAAEKQRQGFADHAWPTCACWSDRGQPPHPMSITEHVCGFEYDKHHPDMRPYADLSESTKEYDRVTARAALAGIEKAGYRLVKAAE